MRACGLRKLGRWTAVEFIKYLYDHVDAWALGTGHLAARASILDSDDYKKAPQRANYAETARSIARLAPRSATGSRWRTP
jgi:ABC-type glycerol-3-phosphate transport system substrate-binding protein